MTSGGQKFIWLALLEWSACEKTWEGLEEKEHESLRHSFT